jgi:hypothetical protein
MCLQWCHVRQVVIDNDLPCTLQCPAAIRTAHQADTCDTCRHKQGDDLCALTHESLPAARTCCHWNVQPNLPERIELRFEDIAPELRAAYRAQSLADIFNMVDSAPDLQDGAMTFETDASFLSVPLVYGVCAACWLSALTGQPDQWCSDMTQIAEEVWGSSSNLSR